MIDSVIIIGVAALLIAILQASVPVFKTEVGRMWLQLIMFFMTGLFNLVNGWVFSGDEVTSLLLRNCFRDGLVYGAAASGIYGIGKNVKDTVVAQYKKYRVTKNKR